MAVTGNIKSQNVGNTNSIWFYACDVLESRVTVSKVEIMLSNGAYHSCDPASWWKCQSLPVKISLPMSVRLTAANNEVLTSTAVVSSFTQGSIFDFGANFGSAAGPLPTPQPTQPTPQPTQPTPQPVTAPLPTPQPVTAPLPTPQPVTVGGGGDCSSASCITVTVVDGNEWWFRAKLSGVPNGVTIEKVEVRNSNSNWETGVFQGWCSTASVGCYDFGSFGSAVTPPLDFQITATSGQVLTALDLVSSFDSAGTMTESFDT